MNQSDKNLVAGIAQKPKFSVAINTKGFQDLIQNTLRDPKRIATFISSITSAVATNPALSECEAGSILSAAFLGESLKLSPSPQLGLFYMIPFDIALKNANGKTAYDKNGEKLTTKKAQFVLGYRGYIQLAIRSGYYKDIDVQSLKEGELKKWNRLTNEVEIDFIEDLDEREKLPTTHYSAKIEYLNGFKKILIWTHAQMLSHADKYSKAFKISDYEKLKNNQVPEKDLWKYSSFWYKDFDSMAEKTMLRQIISKWGIMSVELQTAFESDGNVVSMNNKGDFLVEDTYEEAQPPIEIESQPQAIDLTSL